MNVTVTGRRFSGYQAKKFGAPDFYRGVRNSGPATGNWKPVTLISVYEKLPGYPDYSFD